MRRALGRAALCLALAASPAAFAAHADMQGLWFDPLASGWGLTVARGESGNLFAVWYTYDPKSRENGLIGQAQSMWFMVPAGDWVSGVEFRGALYEAFGSAAHLPFDPRAHSTNAIGTASLRMLPDGSLDFSADHSLAPPIHAVLRRFQF